MILFPAIDIKEGKVVRLFQGKFDALTEYSGDPLVIAKQWESLGAKWLHVVDLDGAQTGVMRNQDIIAHIVKTVKIPVQVGGGIRNAEIAQMLFGEGVSRVVLGTKAVEDKVLLKHLVDLHKDKVAVSVDCSKGFVTQRGWTQTSQLKAVDFLKDLEKIGVKVIIYTDIARDGTLQGPNFTGIQEVLKSVSASVIASGGISTLEDIRKLLGLKAKNLLGVITGKAIYEGKLDFREAVRVCSTSA